MASLELGQIGQISRSVKSIEQSFDWYGRVLGMKHLYTFGRLAFFDCGGTRLFLEEDDAPEGRPLAIMCQVRRAPGA